QLRGQPAIWLEAKSPGVFINSPTGVAIKFKDKDRFTFKQFGRILIDTRQEESIAINDNRTTHNGSAIVLLFGYQLNYLLTRNLSIPSRKKPIVW
ncbi:MAG: hypothetical protein J6U55_05725, partial [Bacteroidaceae bacterium]|nr:hypothetical protein [Bacteroidaceae bacterium]